MQMDAEEKDQAVKELEAQLIVMEEKIRLLQEDGGAAVAGTSTYSGLCYSPSCSDAGDDVCYSPSCLHPLSTVGTNTVADAVPTTSNVFDSSSTDAIISGMVDSNYNTVIDNTNTASGLGLTTDTTACYTTESSASLSDIRFQTTTFTGQSIDQSDSMHDYILTGCYSPTCFSGACYSPTCPNFKVYFEIIGTSGSITTDVTQSSLFQHAPHSDSTILHDVSICYSPSCGNIGSATDLEQSATICYSPSCLSRGSSEEDPHVHGDRVDSGDNDENKENLGKKINDNKSKQLDKASNTDSGNCYSPSCFTEGGNCYSPSCVLRMRCSGTNQDSGLLLVDWSDRVSSDTMQSSLNPFITGQDNVMQDNEGQVDWNTLGNSSSLHDSIGGTLESSSHIVGTQELNPFGDRTSSTNTNPFADNTNPYISNAGAVKASCDNNQSVNPFEESNFQIQDFDPFSTSMSNEPMVQTFAGDFDPFISQGTVEILDRSKESEQLLDVFGTSSKGGVVDSSTSELSDSVFASSSPHDTQDSSNTENQLGKTKNKSEIAIERDPETNETMGFDNPVYGSGGPEDSGSIGFGSPFGTTKFGDEFGDLEHIRQYAKLMEEKDRGSDEESSVDFSDSDDPLNLEERTPSAGKTLISNVELYTPGRTKGTGEIEVQDSKSETQNSDATLHSQGIQDMDGLMKTFDQLKLKLGSLGRTHSSELLDVEEPAQSSALMGTEMFNIPSAPDLGDSDFKDSNTARSSSAYSYESNPLSARDFQKMLDFDETGESFAENFHESSHKLQSQLSDADKSFSEIFHETQGRDGALLLDAESGEMVHTDDSTDQLENDMAKVSAMGILPIRETDPQKVQVDDEGNEIMNISDDEVEFVETPRYLDGVDTGDKEKEHAESMEEESDNDMSTEYFRVESDSEETQREHPKLTRESSILGDEDVAARSDASTSYIPSPEIGASSQGFPVDDTLGKENTSKIFNSNTDQSVPKSAEMDVSSEDVGSLDGDVELKTPKDYDRRLSHDRFEIDMNTNNGVVFQSKTNDVDIEQEQEVETLEVDNETMNLSSSLSSPREENRANRRKDSLDEEIPEEIEIKSSEEDDKQLIEDEQKAEKVDTKSVADKITSLSSIETSPIRESTSMKQVAKGDEIMEISGDEMEYVETPRSLEMEEELKESGKRTDTDSSTIEETALFMETNEDGEESINTHPKLTRRSSVLGDEGVAGRSDADVHYIPSPQIGQVTQEFVIGEILNKKKSSEVAQSVVQSADMEVSTEDAESIESDVELRTSQDYDRRLSHDGFEVDVDANDGVLLQSLTSGELEEFEKLEKEILNMENEETPISSTTSSPSKEKKAVTFGKTYKLMEMGDEVREVSLGDSVEFVESSSEDDSEDYADEKETKDDTTEILDSKPFYVGKLGDETVECSDEEYVKTPRVETESANDISVEKEIDFMETPRDFQGTHTYTRQDSDENRIPEEMEFQSLSQDEEEEQQSPEEQSIVDENKHSRIDDKLDDDKHKQLSEDETETRDRTSNEDRAADKSDVSYGSDYSDDAVSSDFLDGDDEFSDRVDPRRTMGRTYNATKESDEDESTSSSSCSKSSESKTKDRPNSRQDSDDDSIPEEIEFESSDGKDEAGHEETMLTMTTMSDVGDDMFDLKDSQSLEAGTVQDEIRVEEGNSSPRITTMDVEKIQPDTTPEETFSATYKVEIYEDESAEVDDTNYIETAREELTECATLPIIDISEVTDEVIGTPKFSDTYQIENHDNENIEVDDMEYVETPRKEPTGSATETKNDVLDVKDEVTGTPRSPSRVIGNVYAESDSDESDIQEVEEQSVQLPAKFQDTDGQTENLGRSISSTTGSETSELTPFNDNKFGRTCEVLHGDDDDVEYFERWHGPSETTSTTDVKQKETLDKEEEIETHGEGEKSEQIESKDTELTNKVSDVDRQDQNDFPDDILDSKLKENSEMEQADRTLNGKSIVETALELDQETVSSSGDTVDTISQDAVIENDPNETEDNETKIDILDAVVEESYQNVGNELGRTFKAEAYEDKVTVVDDDEGDVETPRDEMDEPLAEKSRSLSVEQDVTIDTPRTPRRVIGSMFADSDSDESDANVKSDDEPADEPMMVPEKQTEKDSNDVYGKGIVSTIGSETSEVVPFNDDKFGRNYEVLHGDDDDVEYIERWHGPPSTAFSKPDIIPKDSPRRGIQKQGKIDEVDSEDTRPKNEVSNESSEDENEFLDDMLATKFYENSGAGRVDQSLELSGPILDVRSVVETTSHEQIEKEDNEDEKLEQDGEEIIFAKSHAEVENDDRIDTMGTGSSRGLGLMNILASNVESPDDVLLVSIVREDFDITQAYRSPFQRTTPRIVELTDEDQIATVEGTSKSTDNDTLETLNSEARTKELNVLTAKETLDLTSDPDLITNETAKDESYKFSMEVKDVFGEENKEQPEEPIVAHKMDSELENKGYAFSLEVNDVIEDLEDLDADHQLPKREEELSEDDQQTDNYAFSMEIKDVIEDIDELSISQANDVLKIHDDDDDDDNDNDGDDENKKYSYSLEIKEVMGELEEETRTTADYNASTEPGYNFSLLVKEVITEQKSNDDILPEVKSYIAGIIEKASGTDTDPNNSQYITDNTAIEIETVDTGEQAENTRQDDDDDDDILPEVKVYIEGIIQSVCDVIVERESQKVVMAIKSDNDDDLTCGDSSAEAIEKEIQKDGAITGFEEAPYRATFSKESVDDVDNCTNTLNSNIEDVIAVDSSNAVLEAPSYVVIDEYETDSDAGQSSRPTSGIGKKNLLAAICTHNVESSEWDCPTVCRQLAF